MGAADRRQRVTFRVDRTAARRVWSRLSFIALAACLARASASDAAVSCADPDSLCKGNPCITGAIEVESPCVVDFGDRALVIGGAMKVPNGGVLSLSAGSIDVRRPILGRHAKQGQGDGATITLSAVRDLIVDWRINASARKNPGAIHLIAGGDVELRAPVRASSTGLNPRAPGGTLSIDAGGTITGVNRARIRVQGDTSTAGGSVTLHAGRGVHLAGPVFASGMIGGSIQMNSDAGGVFLDEPLDASGDIGDGGSVMLVAASGAVTLHERVDVEGGARGGSIAIISALAVKTEKELRAGSRILANDGGSVTVASNADVTIGDVIYADGKNGGHLTVASQNGTARIQAPLVGGGNRGIGGSVLLTGGPSVIVGSSVDADGFTQGGSIFVNADAVNLTSHGTLFARGNTGGTINVSGDMVTVPAGGKVLVDGDQPGGSISFEANAGDLILDGSFRARGRIGGRIEGSASGDVVASGDFAARGNGCIAFTAGSSLDISHGAFDVPIVPQCP